ncbi:MAG: ParD-like family protein [Candidatus Latescibacteria bacterium]|nr:ParD-like family protein [Candidatus Latescibacterota bacterium]
MSTAVRISEDLFRNAKIQSKVQNRSLTGQIEFWAKIGKIAEENPDMPYNLLKELLIGIEQLDNEQGTEYIFG